MLKKTITVGKLINMLSKLPDDTIIVTRGHDHSYRPIDSGTVEFAEQYNGRLYETFDAETPVVSVFVIE